MFVVWEDLSGLIVFDYCIGGIALGVNGYGFKCVVIIIVSVF